MEDAKQDGQLGPEAARTTTESGTETASGLNAAATKVETETSVSPTARKVNAGSSDR